MVAAEVAFMEAREVGVEAGSMEPLTLVTTIHWARYMMPR